MPFQPGQSGNPNGTPGPKGFTVRAKQAFQLAFEGMGGVEALTNWGIDNPTDFYKIYGRLIPVDLKVEERIVHPLDTVDFAAFAPGERQVLRQAAQFLLEKQKALEDRRE